MTALEQVVVGMFGYMTDLSRVDVDAESRSIIEVEGTADGAVPPMVLQWLTWRECAHALACIDRARPAIPRVQLA